MSSYMYKRNKDGVHYIDIAKTWEKLMVAARIIAATQAHNKQDVLVSFYFYCFRYAMTALCAAPLLAERARLLTVCE